MNKLTPKPGHKLKSLAIVSLGGFSVMAGWGFFQNNETFYRNYIMPAVHLLDPETSHNLALFAGKHRLYPTSAYKDPSPLKITLVGHHFANPVGIAAGFDKNGEAVLALQDIGFGFVEIGSVTPQPQPGNPKPRVFRLTQDSAVINRYGFNSDGHEAVLTRLEQLRLSGKFQGILGVNLGKNKDSVDPVEDYRAGIVKFSNVADYYVVNISSPNTPNLRNLQAKVELENLLKIVIKTRNETCPNIPILLKLAPDLNLSELIEVSSVIQQPDCLVDGLVLCNTTISRPASLLHSDKVESGGLSGEPLKQVSTSVISDLYRLTGGRVAIVGVGGVASGRDAYEKIRAGASLVQVYTSLVYEGPPVVARIKRELAELLARDGFKSVGEAVGVDVGLDEEFVEKV